jgi:cholesterol oxidase
MQRLSKSIDEMGARYQVVVVGSGYGGSIAACRLAQWDIEVCLLERGREIHPGEYPRTMIESLRETQTQTALGHFGSDTALFDLHLHNDISVLVGCGLGGTSLINANVALRPHPRVFDERWPQELRGQGRTTLDPYFEKATDMLGSAKYGGLLPLPKLDALQRSADALGAQMRMPPINVTFKTGHNAAGVEQQACTLCGDCCSGCNYGAKNTVLMNYLPAAFKNNAYIFTGIEVQSVLPDRDEWLVAFNVVGRKGTVEAPRQVRAKVVILAAGTLGSTEILLRSRAAGLPVSDRLGHRFSGNGDVLGFAYDTDRSVRSVGRGWRPPPTPQQRVGPCITGLIDLSDDPHPDRQLIIEEGVAPGPLAPVYPGMFYATSLRAGVDTRRRIGKFARWLVEAASLPRGAYRGPVDRTLTYLVMSTDSDHGRLALQNDRLTVRWPGAGSESVIAHDDDRLTAAAEALDGTLVPDPLWAFTRNRRLITVHPLGGCVMGDDAEMGVVDHKGQVFSGKSGTGRHEGLYVMDGAVVPRPLDVNPLLTISGLTERAVELLAIKLLAKDEDNQPVDRPPPVTTAIPPWTSAIADGYRKTAAGLEFTEHMSGFFSTSVPDEDDGERKSSPKARRWYAIGCAMGRDDASPIDFVLTVKYGNLDALLDDQAVPGTLTGTVSAPALSPTRLVVTTGRFTLLAQDPDYVDTWHMRYEMELQADENGPTFQFEGFKLLHTRPGLHGWPDTTTLYMTIREGPRPIGCGVMRLTLRDLLQALGTVTVTGVSDRRQRRWYHVQYLRMFLRSLLKIYGGSLDEPGRFPAVRISTAHQPPLLRTEHGTPQVWWRGSSNRGWTHGTQLGPDAYLRLTRYNGGKKGPVMLAPGFGMSALSFATSTIAVNLPEYLVNNGYDVWLFDYRAGIDLPSSRQQFTIDDIAKHDWPVAVEMICKEAGAPNVQAVGHCVGSVSLMMALLDGMQGVRSAVCAQFTTHVETSWFNLLKAKVHLSELMGLALKGVGPDTARTLPDELLDVFLRPIPIAREERCGLALCRWVNAIYGCTHRHAELNNATHQALPDMFGWGNIDAFNHFALMVRKHRAVNHRGEDVYLRHPERMRLPTLFLQGQRNYIFHPEGSKRTVQWLRRHNGPGFYQRVVFPKYAHLDALAGRDAHRDVYPTILRHLEKTAYPSGGAPASAPTPHPTPAAPPL